MKMDRLFGEEWPRIEGDGLTLRKLELSDAPALLEMLSDEELYRFKPGEPHKNMTYAEHMVGWLERDYRKKKMMVLAICDDQREGRLVGTLEVFDADEKVGMVTFGYTLTRCEWGKGYATRASLLLLGHLFDTCECNRVQAFVMPQNTRSAAVLGRCGFTQEGLIRQGAFWRGRGVIDELMFSRLRSEWHD